MKAERKFRRHQIRKIVGNKFLQAEWEKYQKERGGEEARSEREDKKRPCGAATPSEAGEKPSIVRISHKRSFGK